jgi:hypothetical protein
MKKTVNLSRYIKKTKDGRTTRFWSPENQPEMIVKVVEGQGLRATWADEFQGLYVDAEMQSQEAQTELDQAVRVKSSETPKEQKPISDILGKPETRSAAPKKHDCTENLQDAGVKGKLVCGICGKQFDKPFTAPADTMRTDEKEHDERNKLQAEMKAKMEAARTAPKAENDAQAEKPTDDTPAAESQNVAQPGPQIRPSLQQIINKFPARLKITEGYKTLIELAADFPDQLLEILREKPVESLADLGAVLKAISVKVDQMESGGSETPKAEPPKKGELQTGAF